MTAAQRRRVRVGRCPHCLAVFRMARASADDMAAGLEPMQTCPRCFSWMGYTDCRPELVDRDKFDNGEIF